MQKAVIYFFYKIGTDYKWRIFAAVALILILLALRATTVYDRAYYYLRDNEPSRGAATVKYDSFGDRFDSVVYLNQNWGPDDSLWFYTTTQGSNLLPYDFFVKVEQKDKQEPFASPENMNRYRYLAQKPTNSNPDGLPVGMVADFYQGKKYMGFTCAACHTSQVNYKKVGIRIDGGPGAADMDGFMKGLAEALTATVNDPAKRQRFVAAVLESKNYKDGKKVENDLKTYALRISAYNFFNESPTEYGYARLDAFGRIYNRVLEHVLTPEALRELLLDSVAPGDCTAIASMEAIVAKFKTVLSATDRDRVLERVAEALTPEQKETLRTKIFNPADAPVSYPFLWDIPQHDFVQWNGLGANAGVGPIGRNAGEVIGVFATLDWSEKKGSSLAAWLGGQPEKGTYIHFKSSVDVQNLRHLEDRLWSLHSPLYEEAAKVASLPALKEDAVKRGKILFDQQCVMCHAHIVRDSNDRRVVAHMDKVCENGQVCLDNKICRDGIDCGLGTDPKMAQNSVDYKGHSGIIRNLYSGTDVGRVLLENKAPVAAILTTATQNVLTTPDPDKWWFTSLPEWAFNLYKEFTDNRIKPSLKAGTYTPDVAPAPFESLRAYKARPLNGIWATAPYLHNGSVPTLYDLLLPAECQKGEVPGTDCRPVQFRVGSRELEPVKMGFKSGVDDYKDGFLFDTTQPGNSNKGHDYNSRSLTKTDREDLVEYMKSL